jgi:hypothetical protein
MQQLATIEIVLYAPGFTASKQYMDAMEEESTWITQEVIDDWARPNRFNRFDTVDGSPYLVARAITDEEAQRGIRGEYIFTDWAMTVDIKSVDVETAGTGCFAPENWLHEEVYGFGMEYFLQVHLESILTIGCQLADSLYRPSQFKYDEAFHHIRFLSLWRMECHKSSGPDGDDYSCDVWLDGRIDPKSLKVIE